MTRGGRERARWRRPLSPETQRGRVRTLACVCLPLRSTRRWRRMHWCQESGRHTRSPSVSGEETRTQVLSGPDRCPGSCLFPSYPFLSVAVFGGCDAAGVKGQRDDITFPPSVTEHVRPEKHLFCHLETSHVFRSHVGLLPNTCICHLPAQAESCRAAAGTH